MLRIIGFCVGSLLSIAALLLLFGTPDFHRGARDADEERFDAAIENLRRKWEQPRPAPVNDAVAATAEPPPAAMPDTAGGPTSPEPDIAIEPDKPHEPEWHAIWSPFRTEIAARGFVSRLESVTGLDFRVAKLRSGAYQVAFAYGDPAELDAGLAQIATATGLDLSAERP